MKVDQYERDKWTVDIRYEYRTCGEEAYLTFEKARLKGRVDDQRECQRRLCVHVH